MKNYPIKLEKKDSNAENRLTRATICGDLVLIGKNELCSASFMKDAARRAVLKMYSEERGSSDTVSSGSMVTARSTMSLN